MINSVTHDSHGTKAGEAFYWYQSEESATGLSGSLPDSFPYTFGGNV